MSMTNLNNLICDAKAGKPATLTDVQKHDLLCMVSKYCRTDTVNKLARRINLPLSLWQDAGLFSRVTVDDQGVNYICGQSWRDEMRTLRDLILYK